VTEAWDIYWHLILPLAIAGVLIWPPLVVWTKIQSDKLAALFIFVFTFVYLPLLLTGFGILASVGAAVSYEAARRASQILGCSASHD
jgi:hypothetical protein